MVRVKVEEISFGRIRINGQVYRDDIVIDNGKISYRRKEESRKQKFKYGHTPLTVHENIPWNCKKLVIGTGHYGSLPIEEEVKAEAKRRGVELIIEKTPDAIKHLGEPDTNFVLHLTC